MSENCMKCNIRCSILARTYKYSFLSTIASLHLAEIYENVAKVDVQQHRQNNTKDVMLYLQYFRTYCVRTYYVEIYLKQATTVSEINIHSPV